ncbi:MAG: hypothetical protein FJY11_00375 [Bacteroidetes bacterium]|nr:hypothetical protein [Bacteroidota bacterium]
MKYIALASRIIAGILFVFSGFVKGVDPVGSQIKFSDYLAAAGMSLPDSILLVAAMLLCAIEFITGVMLITGSLYKTGVMLYTIFMAIFTPLTLILAIFNPVSDCGCFGDAVHLTNWETFFKNLVLLIPGAVMLADVRKKTRSRLPVMELLTISSSLLIFVAFMIINVVWLPVIDFRPYKVGVNLTEAMSIPEDAPQDIYSTTLIYEKDGIRKEFSLENYPADDSTWKFIDQKSVLVRKGYEPPVRDFHVAAFQGGEITNTILYSQDYSLLMISHNLGKAGRKNLDEGFMRGFGLAESGVGFYVVTSSPADEIARFVNGLRFCTADGTLLKTIVRSNPGYLLIKEGTILAKWSPASLPDDDWFSSNISAAVLRRSANRNAAYVTWLFFFVIAGTIAVIRFSGVKY